MLINMPTFRQENAFIYSVLDNTDIIFFKCKVSYFKIEKESRKLTKTLDLNVLLLVFFSIIRTFYSELKTAVI